MTWLDVARRVVDTKSYLVVHPDTCEPVPTRWENYEAAGEHLVAVNGPGVLLDLSTAQHMLGIHEALGPEARAKFEALPLVAAANVTWKLVNRLR